MVQIRNRISEIIPWIAALFVALFGEYELHKVNERCDSQRHDLTVVVNALAEIKAATEADITPSQKTHDIEQVLAATELECKVKVD